MFCPLVYGRKLEKNRESFFIMMFRRLLKPIKSDSFFTFDARGTGKTTYYTQFAGQNFWFMIAGELNGLKVVR